MGVVCPIVTVLLGGVSILSKSFVNDDVGCCCCDGRCCLCQYCVWYGFYEYVIFVVLRGRRRRKRRESEEEKRRLFIGGKNTREGERERDKIRWKVKRQETVQETRVFSR